MTSPTSTPASTPASAPASTPTALVNGEPYALADGLTVDRLVTDLVPGCVVDGAPQGVAVAIDDAVVPRSRWAETVVRPGARVEVVTAVQGG